MTEEVGELKEAIKQLEEKLVESSEALKDLQGNKVKDFSFYPHSEMFLSCRSLFPIALAFTNQRENTLLKFRDKHWLISCFLCGSENGESCCILKPGEAGGRHQGEEEQPPDRPAEVHEHASNVAVQHCCYQVLLAIATRLLSGASC